MAKAPTKARTNAQARELAELGARIGQLEGILDGIQSGLQGVLQRLDALGALRELTLEASDQASDALKSSELLTDRMNAITLAVAEGIQHVDRAEKRIQATVQRARRQLREAGIESPGVEAEASQLRLLDGDGGEGGGVPPVRADVAAAQPTRAEQLRERLKTLKLSS